MGAYHFFLPWQFRWGAFLNKVPQPIPWALFSINFFFSFLLLAGGILTFVALRAFRRSCHCDYGILVAMAGFWLANALYQIFVPMPLPAHLWPLHVVLLGFAVIAMLAYVVSVLAIRAMKDSARMKNKAP
jgi:predicted membrane metal-binding protein